MRSARSGGSVPWRVVGAVVALQIALAVLLLKLPPARAIMTTLAGAVGIDGPDLDVAARLLGTKTALKEFVAYLDLARLPEGAISARSKLILLYALCGFANFGSVGALIGPLN